ncbi:MAG: fasciclin domain-containing protein, partial [Prevotella sp.]|nr:fasciclin domain-containing protein [Prevotella sp.]
MNYKKFFSRLLLVAALPVMLGLASCKEDIDESNLYTFTGETIEDFLVNRSDQYSSFNYILSRVGYDKILSAYGTYTCFAPNNKAIEEYIDSLYDDTSNKDFEHNGMTSRGLEGLSDSLCNDIALYHLLSTEVMGVDLSNGFTSSTLLGRIISASVDTLTSDIMINNFSAITTMDNELENGVVHEIDNVLRRSNRLVAGELEQHPEFSIFSQALNMTGLGDSLILEKKMAKYTVTNTYNFYVPEECRMGYTLFAESDETLAANNINSIDELIEFANNAYARCADQGSGWYDYYRNKGFQVSTGNDYTSPTNALNMYVRYHILKYFVPYDKLVYSFNEVAKATLF